MNPWQDNLRDAMMLLVLLSIGVLAMKGAFCSCP
jgi:hypothetical protein